MWMGIQPFFCNDENENIKCAYGANICILNSKLTRSVLSSQGIGFISPVMVNTFFTLFSENISDSDFLRQLRLSDVFIWCQKWGLL